MPQRCERQRVNSAGGTEHNAFDDSPAAEVDIEVQAVAANAVPAAVQVPAWARMESLLRGQNGKPAARTFALTLHFHIERTKQFCLPSCPIPRYDGVPSRDSPGQSVRQRCKKRACEFASGAGTLEHESPSAHGGRAATPQPRK